MIGHRTAIPIDPKVFRRAMLSLTMGANAPLDEEQLELSVTWPDSAGVLDCSAFLLGCDGKVRSDADMIFYNQQEGENGSVRIVDSGRGVTRFALDLGRLSPSVERIAVCAVVEGERTTMARFAGLSVLLTGATGACRFKPDVRSATEVSLRLVELYRRSGRWKVRAVGQGFRAGLAPLAISFGVDVSGDAAPSPTETAPPPPAPPPPPTALPLPPPPPAPTRRTDFRSRVPPSNTPGARVASARAAKPAAPDLSLTPEQEVHRWPALAAGGEIVARLAWSSRTGGAQGRARPLRLGLGALYATADGTRGALQEPDNRQAPASRPLLTLGARDQAEAEGHQSITVAAGGEAAIRTAIFYAVVDGSPDWRASSLRLELSTPMLPLVSLTLEEGWNGYGVLGLVRVELGGDGADIRRLVVYAHDQQELDGEAGWGLDWRPPGPA